MNELLRLHEVTAGYADTVVLEQVSLAVRQDEAISILGRNGVGKSTLLATIMGLTDLRSGRVEFDQREITRLPVHDRPAIGLGYVPQEREIFSSLTVDENLTVAKTSGRVDAHAGLRAVSAIGGAASQQGQSALGRRAANACYRAGADRQPEVIAPG